MGLHKKDVLAGPKPSAPRRFKAAVASFGKGPELLSRVSCRIVAAATQGHGRSEELRGQAGQTGQAGELSRRGMDEVLVWQHDTRYWAQYTDCRGLPGCASLSCFQPRGFLAGRAAL